MKADFRRAHADMARRTKAERQVTSRPWAMKWRA